MVYVVILQAIRPGPEVGLLTTTVTPSSEVLMVGGGSATGAAAAGEVVDVRTSVGGIIVTPGKTACFTRDV